MGPVQLTFASTTRLALFPEEQRRREVLHVLGRVVSGRVVLFAVVDDHLHVVLLCEPEETGLAARALLLALRPVAAVAIAPAHVSEVRGRDHLEWLVRYLLEQPAHHGVAGHPALTTGSCFPDLVGARVVPGLSLQLAAALPRYRLRDAYPLVGLPPERIEPASNPQIRALGAHRLVAGAAQAAAAGPELGLGDVSVRVRTVAAHLAAQVGIPLDELAHALGTTRDATRKMGRRAADPALLAATRTWLALEAASASAGSAAAVAAIEAASARRAAKAGSKPPRGAFGAS